MYSLVWGGQNAWETRTFDNVKECPFCSGKPQWGHKYDNGYLEEVWIECSKCKAQGPHRRLTPAWSILEKCVEDWNQRVSSYEL